jgi:protein subunit release factor B
MADGFSQLEDLLQRRLAAVGVRAEDVEEKFIRGAGPGGQKINQFKLIPKVFSRP